MSINYVTTVPSWDEIKNKPKIFTIMSDKIKEVHESSFQANMVLDEVERMLDRKDSQETIASFIRHMRGNRFEYVTTTGGGVTSMIARECHKCGKTFSGEHIMNITDGGLYECKLCYDKRRRAKP